MVMDYCLWWLFACIRIPGSFWQQKPDINRDCSAARSNSKKAETGTVQPRSFSRLICVAIVQRHAVVLSKPEP